MDLFQKDCFCAAPPSTMAESDNPTIKRREAAKAQAPKPPPEVLPSGDASVWAVASTTSEVRQDVWHLLGRGE